MSRWIRMTGVVCLLAGLDVVPLEAADQGRIEFSGAVVDPTCGQASEVATDSPTSPAASLSDRTRWRSCPSPVTRHVEPTAYHSTQVIVQAHRAAHFAAFAWLRRHGGLDENAGIRMRTRTYR